MFAIVPLSPLHQPQCLSVFKRDIAGRADEIGGEQLVVGIFFGVGLETQVGDVQLDQIKATAQGDTVVTTFEQGYSSSNFKDRTAKALTWQQQDGQWVIVRESNR